MHILNMVSAIKKMPVKELNDLIFANYYQRILFARKNNHYSMKHLKKDICNIPRLN